MTDPIQTQSDARKKADEAWNKLHPYSGWSWGLLDHFRAAVQAEITARLEASTKDPKSPLGHLYAMRDEDLQGQADMEERVARLEGREGDTGVAGAMAQLVRRAEHQATVIADLRKRLSDMTGWNVAEILKAAKDEPAPQDSPGPELPEAVQEGVEILRKEGWLRKSETLEAAVRSLVEQRDEARQELLSAKRVANATTDLKTVFCVNGKEHAMGSGTCWYCRAEKAERLHNEADRQRDEWFSKYAEAERRLGELERTNLALADKLENAHGNELSTSGNLTGREEVGEP